jgi:hypothetical protein
VGFVCARTETPWHQEPAIQDTFAVLVYTATSVAYQTKGGTMIDRIVLVELLNRLCWNVRSYGHDDYGLEQGATIDGKLAEWDDGGVYHPEAVQLADQLLREFNE